MLSSRTPEPHAGFQQPSESEGVERTFCFVDLAGFTALTETHGDEEAADLLLRFERAVTEALGDDATLVDTVGDAAFVVATEPANALSFLTRLWTRALGEPHFPALRAGLHHGEAVQRGERWFGTAVNLAARVAAQARGEQVLATAKVAVAARAAGIEVTSLGEFRLRNLRDPVDLFCLALVAPDSEGSLDPVCRMRVSPNTAVGQLKFAGQTFWFCSLSCIEAFAAEPQAFVSERT